MSGSTLGYDQIGIQSQNVSYENGSDLRSLRELDLVHELHEIHDHCLGDRVGSLDGYSGIKSFIFTGRFKFDCGCDHSGRIGEFCFSVSLALGTSVSCDFIVMLNINFKMAAVGTYCTDDFVLAHLECSSVRAGRQELDDVALLAEVGRCSAAVTDLVPEPEQRPMQKRS